MYLSHNAARDDADVQLFVPPEFDLKCLQTAVQRVWGRLVA